MDCIFEPHGCDYFSLRLLASGNAKCIFPGDRHVSSLSRPTSILLSTRPQEPIPVPQVDDIGAFPNDQGMELLFSVNVVCAFLVSRPFTSFGTTKIPVLVYLVSISPVTVYLRLRTFDCRVPRAPRACQMDLGV